MSRDAGGYDRQNSCTRRAVLRGLIAACLGAGPIGLAACSRRRNLDILAPPSSLRPGLVQLFERRTGIRIRPSAWVSPTDAFAKVFASAARSDVVVGLVDLFAPFAREAAARQLVLALDRSKLPAPSALEATFQADMCFIDGALYMVPVYWGYTAVLYDPAAIAANDPLIDSWGLLFDDRFKGRVALRDDAHESIAAAALYLGHEQPSQMDPAEIRAVKEFLIARKGNFRALWSNFAEAIQLLATGEVFAIFGQPVLAQTLRGQGMAFRMNVPREGLLLFVQGALVPRTALHVEYANDWLQFLLTPESGAMLTEQAAVLSPLQAVRRRYDSAPDRHFGYEALSSGAPLVRLGRPLHLDRWIEAWAEFKAA